MKNYSQDSIKSLKRITEQKNQFSHCLKVRFGKKIQSMLNLGYFLTGHSGFPCAFGYRKATVYLNYIFILILIAPECSKCKDVQIFSIHLCLRLFAFCFCFGRTGYLVSVDPHYNTKAHSTLLVMIPCKANQMSPMFQ